MSTVEDGNTVVLHYTGTLEDGSVFDSSRERDPMEVLIGAGQIIPGFESAIMGMKSGDTRSFTISPEEAYGEYDDNLLHKVEKGRFAEPDSIEEGMVFQIPLTEGRSVPGTVVELSEQDVLIDLNHPLAGKALNFEVECVEIRGG